MYNVLHKLKKREKIMTHNEKIEITTKYLMESEGYTELQAKLEAIRILMQIQLNNSK